MTRLSGYMNNHGGRVIMGLDPGTASTGYGVIHAVGNHLRALDFGVIETAANTPLECRLGEIFDEVGRLLQLHRPSATAIESLFFNVNVRTALAVGQARGVTLLACSRAGCEVFEYTPQQVKLAVAGYGKADKDQVMEMVKALLGLRQPPRPDHASDALGVAICHANTCGIRERVEQCRAGGAREVGLR
ncbi:MAG: crossover junction endodeoxyribonuclease RuvC [Thermoleophilia bacterium]